MNVGRAEPPDGSFSSIRMNHHGIGSRCFCENLISGPECGIDAAAGGGLSANAVDMNHCFKRSETGSVYTVFNEKIQQYKSEKIMKTYIAFSSKEGGSYFVNSIITA